MLPFSKYDVAKVRVFTDGKPGASGSSSHEQEGHFYIFSRLLLAQMLTTAYLRSEDALQVALAVKRLIVDSGFTDITQTQLERILERVLAHFEEADRLSFTTHHRHSATSVRSSADLGRQACIDSDQLSVTINHDPRQPPPPPDVPLSEEVADLMERYRCVRAFLNLRQAIVVFLMGTAGIGKSFLAMKLAERLNVPNVLTTRVAGDLMLHKDGKTIPRCKVFDSDEDAIAHFHETSAIVCSGLKGDLDKAWNNGKSIIFEGLHLNPSLFFDIQADEPPSPDVPLSPPFNPDHKPPSPRPLPPASHRLPYDTSEPIHEDLPLDDHLPIQTKSSASSVLRHVTTRRTALRRPPLLEYETSGSSTGSSSGKESNGGNGTSSGLPQALVVPFLVVCSREDHKEALRSGPLLETAGKRLSRSDFDKLLSNLQTIQRVFLKYASSLNVVRVRSVDPSAFDSVLGHLQEAVFEAMRMHVQKVNQVKQQQQQQQHRT
ncbi:unnamed protein product [Vitrella brassicaformis CCMP3155]|uniref:Uncharacterized protein n=1 Tax=Vitrella brassicaformis (strain CCMP3155) TaxID=1169540 RepID=A0A0G4FF08_VITBC|nr:unnamed protein product [Vitrella brassicaformis CCMP3155]|eukprot:CEM11410.1 unnamed protein product [Vitrella brassicaformis CCMP3155]